MSLQVINTGTINMDGTADRIRTGFIKANENFKSVFAGTGLMPQWVNVSLPNDQLGDTAYVAFNKINANFATIFPILAPGSVPYMVNVGPGQYPNVIGRGDTGVLAWIKVNNNFAILNH
jgi:hypothetical protein